MAMAWSEDTPCSKFNNYHQGQKKKKKGRKENYERTVLMNSFFLSVSKNRVYEF